jgi:hypothetical protein
LHKWVSVSMLFSDWWWWLSDWFALLGNFTVPYQVRDFRCSVNLQVKWFIYLSSDAPGSRKTEETHIHQTSVSQVNLFWIFIYYHVFFLLIGTSPAFFIIHWIFHFHSDNKFYSYRHCKKIKSKLAFLSSFLPFLFFFL